MLDRIVNTYRSHTWLHEDDLRQVPPSERPLAHAFHGALDLLEKGGLSPPTEHGQHLLQRLEHLLKRRRRIRMN